MANIDSSLETPQVDNIPIIFVRGTYFAVGYTIGRTFKSMIRELLETWSYFNDELLPRYNQPEGQEIYSNSLNRCNKKFPHYVEEIKGMALGSDIDFYKLFLVNIDSMMFSNGESFRSENIIENGCTSIICNKDEVILGHTEDAVTEIMNNIYLVSAEINNDKGEMLEKFTSLSYAGHLVGYTMGYNTHKMVYSVNTLFPPVYTSGTPRSFIARALLNCSSLKEAIEIMKDSGTGISDGFSLNLCLKHKKRHGYQFYNIEVAPPTGGANESVVHIQKVKRGESFIHSNKYLRIDVPEQSDFPFQCSTRRHDTFAGLTKTKPIDGIEDIKCILSDSSDDDFPIFICRTDKLFIKTVAAGLFDLNKQTYSIYTGPPLSSAPLAVLKMDL